MLGRALGIVEGLSTREIKYSDSASISSWAIDYVNAMDTRGFIQGTDGKIQSKGQYHTG